MNSPFHEPPIKQSLIWSRLELPQDTSTIHPEYTQYVYNTFSKVILIVKNEFPAHENPILLIKQSLIGSKLELLQIHLQYTPNTLDTDTIHYQKLF